MAVILNATLSGEYANSYATTAYCDEYWADHFNQTKTALWDALGDSQKENVLVQACRVLETARFTRTVLYSEIDYYYEMHSGLVRPLSPTTTPVKFISTQALQFPRNLDVDSVTGVAFIPEPILVAQCEQAVYLLTYDESAVATRLKGVLQESVRLGDLGTSQTLTSGTAWSPMALDFCRPFFIKSSSKLRRA